MSSSYCMYCSDHVYHKHNLQQLIKYVRFLWLGQCLEYYIMVNISTAIYLLWIHILQGKRTPKTILSTSKCESLIYLHSPFEGVMSWKLKQASITIKQEPSVPPFQFLELNYVFSTCLPWDFRPPCWNALYRLARNCISTIVGGFELVTSCSYLCQIFHVCDPFFPFFLDYSIIMLRGWWMTNLVEMTSWVAGYLPKPQANHKLFSDILDDMTCNRPLLSLEDNFLYICSLNEASNTNQFPRDVSKSSASNHQLSDYSAVIHYKQNAVKETMMFINHQSTCIMHHWRSKNTNWNLKDHHLHSSI